MQNLYQVKTRYSLPQAKADFEYKWFVYQRNNNNFIFEQNSQNSKVLTNKLAMQIITELFTFEEAYQLKAILETVYAELGECFEFRVTIEQADIAANLNKICTLKETFQDGGEFVDPYVFAELDCNNLDFLVAAAVDNLLQYMAEDFLQNLSACRLETLRRMHAENDG